MNAPRLSELDLYINDIVDKLRAEYGYSEKNRLKSKVRFYFREIHYKIDKVRQVVDRVIEIPYTELKECMEKGTLPKEIQKLL